MVEEIVRALFSDDILMWNVITQDLPARERHANERDRELGQHFSSLIVMCLIGLVLRDFRRAVVSPSPGLEIALIGARKPFREASRYESGVSNGGSESTTQRESEPQVAPSSKRSITLTKTVAAGMLSRGWRAGSRQPTRGGLERLHLEFDGRAFLGCFSIIPFSSYIIHHLLLEPMNIRYLAWSPPIPVLDMHAASPKEIPARIFNVSLAKRDPKSLARSAAEPASRILE